jgi:glutamyl-tRNA synthetase
VRERARTLVEVAVGLRMFYDRRASVEIEAKAAEKFLTAESRALLVRYAERLIAVEPFTAERLEAATNEFLAAEGVPMKAVGQPARVALTGGTVSPPLFDCMEIFGRDVALARLRANA